jgi:hypothetical protein
MKEGYATHESRSPVIVETTGDSHRMLQKERRASKIDRNDMIESQRAMLAGAAGLEPATTGFGDRYSTN